MTSSCTSQAGPNERAPFEIHVMESVSHLIEFIEVPILSTATSITPLSDSFLLFNLLKKIELLDEATNPIETEEQLPELNPTAAALLKNKILSRCQVFAHGGKSFFFLPEISTLFDKLSNLEEYDKKEQPVEGNYLIGSFVRYLMSSSYFYKEAIKGHESNIDLQRLLKSALSGHHIDKLSYDIDFRTILIKENNGYETARKVTAVSNQLIHFFTKSYKKCFPEDTRDIEYVFQEHFYINHYKKVEECLSFSINSFQVGFPENNSKKRKKKQSEIRRWTVDFMAEGQLPLTNLATADAFRIELKKGASFRPFAIDKKPRRAIFHTILKIIHFDYPEKLNKEAWTAYFSLLTQEWWTLQELDKICADHFAQYNTQIIHSTLLKKLEKSSKAISKKPTDDQAVALLFMACEILHRNGYDSLADELWHTAKANLPLNYAAPHTLALLPLMELTTLPFSAVSAVCELLAFLRLTIGQAKITKHGKNWAVQQQIDGSNYTLLLQPQQAVECLYNAMKKTPEAIKAITTFYLSQMAGDAISKAQMCSLTEIFPHFDKLKECAMLLLSITPHIAVDLLKTCDRLSPHPSAAITHKKALSWIPTILEALQAKYFFHSFLPRINILFEGLPTAAKAYLLTKLEKATATPSSAALFEWICCLIESSHPSLFRSGILIWIDALKKGATDEAIQQTTDLLQLCWKDSQKRHLLIPFFLAVSPYLPVDLKKKWFIKVCTVVSGATLKTVVKEDSNLYFALANEAKALLKEAEAIQRAILPTARGLATELSMAGIQYEADQLNCLIDEISHHHMISQITRILNKWRNSIKDDPTRFFNAWIKALALVKNKQMALGLLPKEWLDALSDFFHLPETFECDKAFSSKMPLADDLVPSKDMLLSLLKSSLDSHWNNALHCLRLVGCKVLSPKEAIQVWLAIYNKIGSSSSVQLSGMGKLLLQLLEKNDKSFSLAEFTSLQMACTSLLLGGGACDALKRLLHSQKIIVLPPQELRRLAKESAISALNQARSTGNLLDAQHAIDSLTAQGPIEEDEIERLLPYYIEILNAAVAAKEGSAMRLLGRQILSRLFSQPMEEQFQTLKSIVAYLPHEDYEFATAHQQQLSLLLSRATKAPIDIATLQLLVALDSFGISYTLDQKAWKELCAATEKELHCKGFPKVIVNAAIILRRNAYESAENKVFSLEVAVLAALPHAERAAQQEIESHLKILVEDLISNYENLWQKMVWNEVLPALDLVIDSTKRLPEQESSAIFLLISPLLIKISYNRRQDKTRISDTVIDRLNTIYNAFTGDIQGRLELIKSQITFLLEWEPLSFEQEPLSKTSNSTVFSNLFALLKTNGEEGKALLQNFCSPEGSSPYGDELLLKNLITPLLQYASTIAIKQDHTLVIHTILVKLFLQWKNSNLALFLRCTPFLFSYVLNISRSNAGVELAYLLLCELHEYPNEKIPESQMGWQILCKSALSQASRSNQLLSIAIDSLEMSKSTDPKLWEQFFHAGVKLKNDKLLEAGWHLYLSYTKKEEGTATNSTSAQSIGCWLAIFEAFALIAPELYLKWLSTRKELPSCFSNLDKKAFPNGLKILLSLYLKHLGSIKSREEEAPLSLIIELSNRLVLFLKEKPAIDYNEYEELLTDLFSLKQAELILNGCKIMALLNKKIQASQQAPSKIWFTLTLQSLQYNFSSCSQEKEKEYNKLQKTVVLNLFSMKWNASQFSELFVTALYHPFHTIQAEALFLINNALHTKLTKKNISSRSNSSDQNKLEPTLEHAVELILSFLSQGSICKKRHLAIDLWFFKDLLSQLNRKKEPPIAIALHERKFSQKSDQDQKEQENAEVPISMIYNLFSTPAHNFLEQEEAFNNWKIAIAKYPLSQRQAQDCFNYCLEGLCNLVNLDHNSALLCFMPVNISEETRFQLKKDKAPVLRFFYKEWVELANCLLAFYPDKKSGKARFHLRLADKLTSMKQIPEEKKEIWRAIAIDNITKLIEASHDIEFKPTKADFFSNILEETLCSVFSFKEKEMHCHFHLDLHEVFYKLKRAKIINETQSFRLSTILLLPVEESIASRESFAIIENFAKKLYPLGISNALDYIRLLVCLSGPWSQIDEEEKELWRIKMCEEALSSLLTLKTEEKQGESFSGVVYRFLSTLAMSKIPNPRFFDIIESILFSPLPYQSASLFGIYQKIFAAIIGLGQIHGHFSQEQIAKLNLAIHHLLNKTELQNRNRLQIIDWIKEIKDRLFAIDTPYAVECAINFASYQKVAFQGFSKELLAFIKSITKKMINQNLFPKDNAVPICDLFDLVKESLQDTDIITNSEYLQTTVDYHIFLCQYLFQFLLNKDIVESQEKFAYCMSLCPILTSTNELLKLETAKQIAPGTISNYDFIKNLVNLVIWAMRTRNSFPTSQQMPKTRSFLSKYNVSSNSADNDDKTPENPFQIYHVSQSMQSFSHAPIVSEPPMMEEREFWAMEQKKFRDFFLYMLEGQCQPQNTLAAIHYFHQLHSILQQAARLQVDEQGKQNIKGLLIKWMDFLSQEDSALYKELCESQAKNSD